MLDDVEYVLMRIEDILPDLEFQLLRLRRSCQTTLVNALSHESFTPLNKIMSMTESILTKGTTVDHCRKFARLIQDSCERMRLLIQSQIYQFKYESRTLDLKSAPLGQESLDFLFDEIKKSYETDIHLNQMKLKYEFDCAGVPFLRSDWSIFKCTVFHLLGNAIKHGKKGSGITINVTHSEGFLICQISNKCENVNRTDWEKVTAPLFAFERVSKDNDQTSGVGIGISTASTLAEALGGDLLFEVDAEAH